MPSTSVCIQDGFSEEQWQEAEEAVSTAKVKNMELHFAHNSQERSRALQAITGGLAWNKFVGKIVMWGVPEQMQAIVERKLCNSSLTVRVHS